MTSRKKDILIIMGRYLPGYKDGGPVRSIKNLVDYLGDEYNFKILTCDRDHGDLEQYSNIKVNEWNIVGKAQVYYVTPKGFTFKTIKNLANESDLVYCCGCFNDYAINTLILNRFNKIKAPIIIASMGLFSPKEFQLKYIKKKIFVGTFNLLGMFKNIYWSATSIMEVNEIRQQIRLNNNYFIAEDLPRKVSSDLIVKEKVENELKVVWISRITPKKNLKGAIDILKHIEGNVEFNIYGSKHTPEYWEECKEELKKLPNNIKWKWNGELNSENVIEVLKNYHVFLFPTLGENYGHVIHEALSAGCACIISNETPWVDFEENGVGYIYNLNEKSKFIEAINKYMLMDTIEFNKIVSNAQQYAIKNSICKIKNTGYKKIFDILC